MPDDMKFYGCSENPFAIPPDPKFFYASESAGEALAALQYGITYRKGFLLLLAEAGLGKTMLIRRLIGAPGSRVRVIYFPQVQMPFLQMLKEMLIQLNLTPEFETKGSMVHSLYYFLIEGLGRQENVVLVLDQAEQIQLDLLEEVRLLANLETGSSKLLQIVLAGRPELGKKLHSDIVRQIEQRIVIHSRLHPMTALESRRYIDHRLKTAGAGASAVFTDKAMALICKSARGVPRAINILCSNALLLGHCLAENKISAATVEEIRHEKGLLSEEKAEALASRIKGRLPRKLFILVPVIMGLGLGLALFFGRSSIESFFHSQEAHQTAVPSAEKINKTVPILPQIEAKHRTPISPVPKVPRAAEAPRIPVKPPQAVENIEEPVHIKKTVEVSEGANLSLLTLQNYKMVNETLMDHILKLNPEITNPHLLLPHQKIRIPEITEALLIIRQTQDLYKIHLRTFGNLKEAEQYKNTAAAWAGEIEIVPWKISPRETWYRVMTGPFKSRDEALKATAKMKQKGFSFM